MTNLEKERTSRNAAVEVIRSAAQKWPSTFIPRTQVPKFTGNLIAVGTLANADSKGCGIPNAFKIGRQVCYPIESLCDWLIDRMEG